MTAAAPAPPVPAVLPERDALLAAIRADPASDLPRLVYADWQDDHGQPEHAELIRVQCELLRAAGREAVARRRELRGRRNELLRSPPLRAMRRRWWPWVCEVDRGFSRYERVSFDPGEEPDPARLPPLDKVLESRLSFWDDATAERVARAAAQPWFRRVTGLDFLDCRLGPDSLRRLARSRRLGGLGVVEFWQGTVDAGELLRLVLAPAARVCDLRLVADCVVTAGPAGTPDPAALADALARIGRCRRAGGLRELYLDSPQARDAVGRALLGWPHPDRLTQVVLYRSRLSKRVRADLEARFGDRLHWQPG